MFKWWVLNPHLHYCYWQAHMTHLHLFQLTSTRASLLPWYWQTPRPHIHHTAWQVEAMPSSIELVDIENTSHSLRLTVGRPHLFHCEQQKRRIIEEEKRPEDKWTDQNKLQGNSTQMSILPCKSKVGINSYGFYQTVLID